MRARLVGEAIRTSREVRAILMVGEVKMGEASVKEAIVWEASRTSSMAGGSHPNRGPQLPGTLSLTLTVTLLLSLR